jgi:hypothetical protein
LQEIDEIIYAAFLPIKETATVLEFETPVYSKIYTHASPPDTSQRYRAHAWLLRIMQKFFASGNTTALVVLTYIAFITWIIVQLPIDGTCWAYATPAPEQTPDPQLTAGSPALPTYLNITRANMTNIANINITNSSLPGLVNATLAAAISNITNTTI